MMLENLFTGRSPSVIFVFAALQITYWLAVPFSVPPDFVRPLIWTGVWSRRGGRDINKMSRSLLCWSGRGGWFKPPIIGCLNEPPRPLQTALPNKRKTRHKKAHKTQKTHCNLGGSRFFCAFCASLWPAPVFVGQSLQI